MGRSESKFIQYWLERCLLSACNDPTIASMAQPLNQFSAQSPIDNNGQTIRLFWKLFLTDQQPKHLSTLIFVKPIILLRQIVLNHRLSASYTLCNRQHRGIILALLLAVVVPFMPIEITTIPFKKKSSNHGKRHDLQCCVNPAPSSPSTMRRDYRIQHQRN